MTKRMNLYLEVFVGAVTIFGVLGVFGWVLKPEWMPHDIFLLMPIMAIGGLLALVALSLRKPKDRQDWPRK